MKQKLVFDSFALIAFFEDEPGAAVVEDLLNNAQAGTTHLWIHRVNWGEIYYTMFRRKSPKVANHIINQIAISPLNIIDTCDQTFVTAAATIKAKHRISYADAFAIQLALDLKANLVTGDPEIKGVSKKEPRLKLVWLGK